MKWEFFFFSGLVFCYFKEVHQLVARLGKYQRQNSPGTYMIVIFQRLNGIDCTDVRWVVVVWSCTLR